MIEVNEKLRDHQSYYNSPWVEHECLKQSSWQYIQQMLRYFSLDQSGEQTEMTTHKAMLLVRLKTIKKMFQVV